MKNIIQLVEIWKAPVNVDNDDPPEHLHKPYDVLLPFALGYKEDGSPHPLYRKLPFPQWQLYYLQDNPPPGRVRVFLCLCHRKSDIQVLWPHPWWTPVPIWTNNSQGSFNFLLIQDPLCNINQFYHYAYGVIYFIIIYIIIFIIGIRIRIKDISTSLCRIKIE